MDSFALGVPLVTTDFPFHSPEIDYLINGENGVMVDCGENAGLYAEAVIGLFAQPGRIRAMRDQALLTAEKHTIETMAANFASGVMRCLEAR